MDSSHLDFYPALGIKFGYNGIALASALVSFSSLIAILIVKKEIEFSFWKSINKPFFASLLMGILVYLLSFYVGKTIWGILILTIIGCLFYFGLIFLTLRDFLKRD